MSAGRHQGLEYSDHFREEAVAESGGGNMDAPVSSARWQEGKKSVKRARGVPDGLLSCPHNSL